jgi:hypothetical protein
MRCFNHPARQAVAIFTACDKAVCPEYKLESENGFAYQQSCAKILSEKKDLHVKLVPQLNTVKRMNFLSVFFSIGMGILFIYFPSGNSGSSMFLSFCWEPVLSFMG